MAMAPLTAAIPNELKMDNMASTKVPTNLQLSHMNLNWEQLENDSLLLLQWLTSFVSGTNTQEATEAIKKGTPNAGTDEIEWSEANQRIGWIESNQNHSLY